MSLGPELKTLTYLVVDDYESMRIMIADHLKKLGATKILLAASGNEALSSIQSNTGTDTQVGFIITDLMMADGNGLDLVRAVRAKPELKKLPVLMITSKAEVSYVIECVKAGVNNYIVKPWQIEDLEKKIVDSWTKVKNSG